MKPAPAAAPASVNARGPSSKARPLPQPTLPPSPARRACALQYTLISTQANLANSSLKPTKSMTGTTATEEASSSSSSLSTGFPESPEASIASTPANSSTPAMAIAKKAPRRPKRDNCPLRMATRERERHKAMAKQPKPAESARPMPAAKAMDPAFLSCRGEASTFIPRVSKTCCCACSTILLYTSEAAAVMWKHAAAKSNTTPNKK
mmetsp:Transcript_89972/g.259428  ORF Transcript_89972/g.259428 Transcript_89972/m.259428 type:complete len:207 (+) Transcript_89972:152-772(+)